MGRAGTDGIALCPVRRAEGRGSCIPSVSPPCAPALDRGVCVPLPPPPGVETPHVLPEGGFGPEILRQEDPGTQGTPQDSQCHPKATKAPGGVPLESILAHHAGMHPTALLLFEGHSKVKGQDQGCSESQWQRWGGCPCTPQLTPFG